MAERMERQSFGYSVPLQATEEEEEEEGEGEGGDWAKSNGANRKTKRREIERGGENGGGDIAFLGSMWGWKWGLWFVSVNICFGLMSIYRPWGVKLRKNDCVFLLLFHKN